MSFSSTVSKMSVVIYKYLMKAKTALLTVLTWIGLLALPINASLEASSIEKDSLTDSKTRELIAQEPSPDIYQQAKEELPENFYVLYRIIERVARANALDERPWRIVVVPTYDINAFATEVNLIALHTGIMDQLAGDASALACIVAHEMGHHVERHIALGPAEKAALIEEIQTEAELQVEAELKDAKSDSRGSAIGGAIARGVLGGSVGNATGRVLENESRNRMTRAERRIQEIVEQKEQELEQRLAEDSQRREFEADRSGYMYSVQAGFEPEGCLRAMDVLARLPGAEFDTTHPATRRRIEALQELAVENPAARLSQKGDAVLSATEPLTYDLSEDGVSLRINSTRGGSTGDDIERMFD